MTHESQPNTLSETLIDATLEDSFPASDPPSWTLGRERSPETKETQASPTGNDAAGHLSPRIGLSDEQREGVVTLLNTLLSDEYVLYTRTRNYHWNVRGPQFNDLHKFFEEQYTALSEVVDEIAERARSLGGWAFGTLAEFSRHARLAEDPGRYPQAREMIANLLAAHELVIRQLRNDLETCVKKYQDMGSSDFLTGLMEKHEKMAWMLRALLEGEPV